MFFFLRFKYYRLSAYFSSPNWALWSVSNFIYPIHLATSMKLFRRKIEIIITGFLFMLKCQSKIIRFDKNIIFFWNLLNYLWRILKNIKFDLIYNWSLSDDFFYCFVLIHSYFINRFKLLQWLTQMICFGRFSIISSNFKVLVVLNFFFTNRNFRF